MPDPFLGALAFQVHRKLKRLVSTLPNRPKILDVGGRKSPSTIGIPANIIISDLPRESDIQKNLNLGINDSIVRQTLQRRSNIEDMVYDDMTCSNLEDASFDGVLSVEVLEHVEEDEAFVRNVARVLKPGGFFLMTTPNGDYVANTNPDHKRHYLHQQLYDLLTRHFDDVQVEYAVKGSAWRKRSLKPLKLKKPIRTLLSMTGSVMNIFESSNDALRVQPKGTHHLVALARKNQARKDSV